MATVKDMTAVSELVAPAPVPMPPTPGRRWLVLSTGADASLLVVAALLAVFGSRAAGVASDWGVWAFAYPLVVLGLLVGQPQYLGRLRLSVFDSVTGAIAATSIATSLVLSIRVLFTSDPNAAGQSARQWVFATFFLAAGRAAAVRYRIYAQRTGAVARPTLIIGAGDVGQLTARRLLSQPQLGLRPIGFLDKEPLATEGVASTLPVLGASWDLDAVLDRNHVSDVILTFSTAPHHVFLSIIRRCEARGVNVFSVPRLFERMPRNVSIEHLGGLPLLSIPYSSPYSSRFVIKYAIDRVVAAVLLLLALPVLVAAAVAVYLSMGRPILFRQRRVGRDGREFQMLKFRSMRMPQKEDRARVVDFTGFAPGGVEGEDRRTAVGSLLRRSSIDELPQLVNVLKGDMTLVGPRPERPEFVSQFVREVYRYGDRHRLKAGITGWAQIEGLRGRTSLADRVEWDNYYIENWSLWLDVKILVVTFASALSSFRSVE